MKTLLILSAIAALITPAQARLGETMGQVTSRLGPPTTRYGDGKSAWYTWKKENTTIDVFFRDGASYSERYERFSGISIDAAAKYLAAAGPGKWHQGLESGILTNGTLVAEIDDTHVHISAPPSKNATPAQIEKFSRLELIADRQREENEKNAAVAESIATEDQDKAAGIHWLAGKVASKFREGLLINPDGKNFPGNVLLTGHPSEATAVDGIAITARVKITGTFQYRNALGGTHTIYKLAYTGEIPLPDSTAAK